MKLFFVFVGIFTFISCSNDTDTKLERVIKHYNLKPLAVRKFEEDPKYKLGQALFFDNILSGNRDTSCASCHLWNRGSSDNLPVSIGTQGISLAENRYLEEGRTIEHPRNSLDLWNRDNNSVRALFWDGRVEMIDPDQRIFRTPMEDYLPKGLDNTLAVQAVFPLVRPDEMLGKFGDRSRSDLPFPHNDQPNELVTKKNFSSEKERILDANLQILRRILGNGDLEYWQIKYREMFSAAYPNIEYGNITLAHIANAISHFEELAFATRQTNWDDFLSGADNAISGEAKQGALLFYGKGKCVACHTGPLMSDFNYHNVGIPDHGPGIDGNGKDYGRYNVTGNEKDKYRFRTPPLRNVSETAPYFHNGIITNLRDAIKHMNDVTFFSDKYKDNGNFMMRKDQIRSISPILKSGLELSEEEIDQIVAFLETLDSSISEELFNKIMPKSVPSNLDIHRLDEPVKYLQE
jgi:cytochrome c peroxidase